MLHTNPAMSWLRLAIHHCAIVVAHDELKRPPVKYYPIDLADCRAPHGHQVLACRSPLQRKRPASRDHDFRVIDRIEPPALFHVFVGEKESEPFQFTFNGFLKVAFQGSRVAARTTPPATALASANRPRPHRGVRSRSACLRRLTTLPGVRNRAGGKAQRSWDWSSRCTSPCPGRHYCRPD
jgi:hypothetical protein